MTKITIGVRDVDEATFRKFRAFSMAQKMNVGKALTLAMKRTIEEQDKIQKNNVKGLLKLKGIIKTKGKVRWSEEIDEILYG